MIIVLEGCDCAGKTTLAKHLCRELQAEYVHFSKPKGKAGHEYMYFLCQANINKNYVVDRFMLGEQVYGPLFRGKSTINQEEQFYIEHKMKAMGCVLFWCDPGLAEIMKNIKIRGDDHVKVKDCKKIRNQYIKVLQQTTLPVNRYNYTTMSYVNVLLIAKKVMQNTVVSPKVVGNTTAPAVLFVGDELNKKMPFRSVFYSTSGMFLMRTIMELKLTSFCVCNSKGFGSLSIDEIHHLGPRNVVCLGENARERLGKDASFVVHPQFAKRFYGKDAVKRYMKEIKHVLL